MRNKGFTLVELIVVIAIIAVLAAIIAPNAFKAVEKAKISGQIEDFRSIKTAAMAYYADTGVWPASAASPCNEDFVQDTAPLVTGWDGPYLEKWPTTAKWGGTVNWCRVTATAGACTTFDGDAIEDRYVRITSVPSTVAAKVDTALDGGGGGALGDVRYAAGATTELWIRVSKD